MSAAVNVKEMSDEDYFNWMADRREKFYKAGHDFKPVEGCSQCEPVMEDSKYICIYHEIDQLEKKGF
jgi:hypothetical protein